MSLDQITRSLQKSKSQLNFFDHAYRELSHEAVLGYSFSAFGREEGEDSDPNAAAFAAEVLQRCFPDLAPLQDGDAIDTWRQSSSQSGSELRPDFVVRLSRDKTAYWAAIETKLGAPVREAQLKDYRDLLQEEHDASTGGSFSKVVLYKTTPFFDTIRSYDIDPSDLALLTMEEVGKCLETACKHVPEQAEPSWLIQEYRSWVRRQTLTDDLLSHPDFQEWYLADGESIPEAFEDVAENVWPTYPSHRRRVHWHFVRRLAETLGGEEAEMEPYVQSAPNARDDSAWVHVQLASLDNGAVFYRLDTVSSGQAALDLRLYCGPKRGLDREDRSHWVGLKKTIRTSLREHLEEKGLTEMVDTPGRQEYTFQKSARETSMCRFWLPPHERGKRPSEILEAFPEVHRAVVETLQDTGEMRQHIERWALPHRPLQN